MKPSPIAEVPTRPRQTWPERVEGVEAVAQAAAQRQPAEDHRDGEERAEEHRLPRRDVRGRGLDADRHHREDDDREDLQPDAAQRVHGAARGTPAPERRAPVAAQAEMALRPAPSRASRRAPPPTGANISSISASVMVIGGQKASVSPIARPMTPRVGQLLRQPRRRPCPARRSPSGDPSGASSIAPIRPEGADLADQRVPGEPVEVRRRSAARARGPGAVTSIRS